MMFSKMLNTLQKNSIMLQVLFSDKSTSTNLFTDKVQIQNFLPIKVQIKVQAQNLLSIMYKLKAKQINRLIKVTDDIRTEYNKLAAQIEEGW